MKHKTREVTKRPDGAPKDEGDWVFFAHYLAKSFHLNSRQVAAKLGVNVNTMKANYPNICRGIAEGHADFQVFVMTELIGQAQAEPLDFEIEERAQIRNLKADAVKTLSKLTLRREELEELKEGQAIVENALSKLTDEELIAKAKELLNEGTKHQTYALTSATRAKNPQSIVFAGAEHGTR
jgi:DNA-binding transcriptional regulator YhcF (GntR family)